MVLRSCWKSRHKNGRRAACFCWFGRGLAALFCLFVTQLGRGVGASVLGKNVIQKAAEFDVTYNDTVTSDNQTIYAFNHTVSRNKVSPRHSHELYVCSQHRSCSDRCDIDVLSLLLQSDGVRVTVDVLSQGFDSPVLFAVRQKQAVLSFQVPLILRGL